jgi:hypothetical protein
MNDTRARWTRYADRMTRDKLATRRRQAERWRAGERAAEEAAGVLLGVPLAWRRWSLDVDLAERGR